jgi:hypothetical protein
LTPLPESFRDLEGRLQIRVLINISAGLPSFGGVGGVQNEEVLKYDIILFFLLIWTPIE